MRLFMITSRVKIIAFQTVIIHCLWIFYTARKDCSGLAREISRSILEINLVFPRTMYYSLFNQHAIVIFLQLKITQTLSASFYLFHAQKKS